MTGNMQNHRVCREPPEPEGTWKTWRALPPNPHQANFRSNSRCFCRTRLHKHVEPQVSRENVQFVEPQEPEGCKTCSLWFSWFFIIRPQKILLDLQNQSVNPEELKLCQRNLQRLTNITEARTFRSSEVCGSLKSHSHKRTCRTCMFCRC